MAYVAEGALSEGIHNNGSLKHYSSCHQILLVGEGDFSFSLCLAQSFGSASNMVATSLDSYDSVIGTYKKAKSNLENLEKLGAALLHRVNATTMKFHTDLKMRKFDRIIFNFPHAGFHGKEDQVRLIKMHRNLVQGFFRNARGMLRPYGEIHINHKTTGPFRLWNLEELASRHSLVLLECVEFKIDDYPGYKNKRGDGPRCDEPFPLGKCSTYKFVVSHNRRTETQGVMGLDYGCSGLSQVQEIPLQNPHYALQMHPIGYPRTETQGVMDHLGYGCNGLSQVQEIPLQNPRYALQLHPIVYPRTDFILNNMGAPFIMGMKYEFERIFDGYLVEATTLFGRTDHDYARVAWQKVREGLERYMSGGPGRTLHGFMPYLEALQQQSLQPS